MKCSLVGSLWLAIAFAGGAAAQSAGIQAEWDVRAILKEISAHAGRIQKVLEKVDAQAWVKQGATDTYVTQVNSARAQARALASEALDLGRDPERLSMALQTFFRMQYLEFVLPSLDQGIRKYQSAALADELRSVASQNGANRERFKRYIVELADAREQQFRVMDMEAQRCRGFLVRQPVNPSGKSGRK